MKELPSLRRANLRGKRVFIRVDYNVPIESGQITDDRRIRASLPTLRYLIEQGATLILASHLGRPKDGQRDPKYSLHPVQHHLSQLLQKPVELIGDPFTYKELSPSSVYLMENVRFFPGETKNAIEFARALAQWAEAYVSDAFGSVHRAHASVDALPRLMKEKYAGFLLEAEWNNAQRVLTQIEHPYLVVVGGAKVSDKLPLLQYLLPKLDRLLIGGGMSYTFLHAKGLPIGKSLLEREHVQAAQELLAQADKMGKRVLLPSDSLAAKAFQADAEAAVYAHQAGVFPEDRMGLDIGPASIAAAKGFIQGSKTIFWNGPMGVFEWERFKQGTVEVGKAIAEETARGAYSLVGGGDTAAAAEVAGVAEQVSFVSTGGGALLELLAGQTLPGIAALMS
ncbi:MAG: phosphoglycerate kinase [Bacteroidia bacterium]|nr:phosphoglycerate kinase [Bacteroidia bacterium]